MIEKTVKFIFYLALFGCSSNQIHYANAEDKCLANECYILLAQSGQDESSFIRKNQEAVKSSTNSALYTVYRIKCLNTQGKSGLAACNQALSIKPNIPALIKRRLLLSAQLKPKRKPVVRYTPQKPKPVKIAKPIVKPSISKPVQKTKVTQKSIDTLRKEEIARKRTKEIIVNVQRLLIKLGFDVSVADGIAGKNTRKAIKKYIKLSKRKTSSKINMKLLSDLKKALKLQKKADKNYDLAKEHVSDGEFSEALGAIERGLKLLPWHASLITLKTTVHTQIAANNDMKQKELTLQMSLRKADEEALKQKQKAELIALQKAKREAEEQKKLEEQENLKKAREEKKLLAQQQAIRKQEKELRRIEEIIFKARGELNQNNFVASLQSVNKGLLFSPENGQMRQLKENIKSAQKEHQLAEKLKRITKNAKKMFDKNDQKKAALLISEGLEINPNDQTLLSLKETLLAKKAQGIKLSKLLSKSRKLLNDGSFEDVINLASNGLLINPKHPELLEIKQRATEEQEQVMIQISLRKQKISNFLSLIQGKERELLSIEKEITSERKNLFTEAQKTLEKYWVVESSQ